jgi:cold shock CspA family protein
MTEVFYGTVKFYDPAKRFGFIGRDHPGAADVFVGDCGHGLNAADEVSFHIEIEKDGRQRAIDVRVRRSASAIEPRPGAAEECRRVWRHDGMI